jgi:hypothetical protein
MGRGHAYRIQNRGKCVNAFGQFGETMLHKSKSNDEAQRNGSPSGASTLSEQIEKEHHANLPPSMVSMNLLFSAERSWPTEAFCSGMRACAIGSGCRFW